ncbi:uncharacterized protein LACBIDRAFT_310593 [Laccaria bicolor S238N-H82]|uniref:Predicted protein n=1 Tax=Laccaria bicolor (strain S238N-H82 / ATCC MYA-4686) TaxID=486041 RepID=B0DUN3_LACBS|nr:uncharacterized protein LACBIDRAFT_310593 [Laccaria bicolor S238N-H82]EDR01646.1 predicted protein [Laccaria bicolor S238N-H82]|eukprot:XP_001887722.1 predicted protein [Laccaria bicolor S238N-H82]
MANKAAKLDDATSFLPAYALQSDVDISSVALTGMKQSGLCVTKSSGFDFHPDDSYPILDTKLQALFPKLFTWLWKAEPDDATTSSWLICMKPPRRNLAVYSDDRLPTGMDIIDACKLANTKVGVSHRTLFLVTRYPVPAATLLEWKPRISLAQDPVVNKDSDVDDTDNDTPSPTLSAIPLPCTQRSLRPRHVRSEDEVEQDIISISSMSDGESSAPAPKIPIPVTKAPTISSIEVMQDFFHSSFNFDNEENPWVPRA